MTFFAQKYVLNKIYSQDVFLGIHYFKTLYYLVHCGVMLAQSFGSHIRPQSSRLGLNEGHLLAKPYSEKAHKFDHEGAMVSLHRSRQKAWVSYYG